MKYTTIIDPAGEEEIIIHTRARTREIEALEAFADQLGKELNMEIRVMHEDIFNSMHRI